MPVIVIVIVIVIDIIVIIPFILLTGNVHTVFGQNIYIERDSKNKARVHNAEIPQKLISVVDQECALHAPLSSLVAGQEPLFLDVASPRSPGLVDRESLLTAAILRLISSAAEVARGVSSPCAPILYSVTAVAPGQIISLAGFRRRGTSMTYALLFSSPAQPHPVFSQKSRHFSIVMLGEVVELPVSARPLVPSL